MRIQAEPGFICSSKEQPKASTVIDVWVDGQPAVRFSMKFEADDVGTTLDVRMSPIGDGLLGRVALRHDREFEQIIVLPARETS